MRFDKAGREKAWRLPLKSDQTFHLLLHLLTESACIMLYRLVLALFSCHVVWDNFVDVLRLEMGRKKSGRRNAWPESPSCPY